MVTSTKIHVFGINEDIDLSFHKGRIQCTRPSYHPHHSMQDKSGQKKIQQQQTYGAECCDGFAGSGEGDGKGTEGGDGGIAWI